MRIPLPDSLFGNDDRGVAPVIGFVILFGFLVIALTTYQAQVVPQENSEIEFQHFQEARDDMVEVRSSISTAGQTDVSQYPTVTLGTTYPPRKFTLNPSPPSGTLQTSTAYNISIRNQSGADPNNISTRFLRYQNGYNEIDIGPIWYEHSVLYVDERDTGGGIAIYEDQNIITGDGNVRINALQNGFTRTSTARIDIELYTTDTAGLEELSGTVIIHIPTRLNESEYWGEEMSEYDAYNGVDENAIEQGVHLLNLTVDTDALKFNTVGIQEEPNAQDSVKQGLEEQESEERFGTGGISTYSEEDNTETVSQANGRWEGINCTDKMVLSDAAPARRPDGNNFPDSVLRISGRFTNDTGDEYIVDVQLARNKDGSWNKKNVVIHYISVNDHNQDSADLTDQAVSAIYESGSTDLLSTTSYESPSRGEDSFVDYLTDIQNLSKPVTWQTPRMIGRVDLSLKCSE